MPYQNLMELEKDINDTSNEIKLLDRITHVILEIEATDTRITVPWMFAIIKRNKTAPPWNIIYTHWVELRKLFGKNTDEDIPLSANDILKIVNKQYHMTNHTDEIKNHIQNHLLEAGQAIKNIPVIQENLSDIRIFVCTIIGINNRFFRLDKSQGEGILHGWLIYWTTEVIKKRTGKNRKDNFEPIYTSALSLIHQHSILRNSISTSIIPLKPPGDDIDTNEKKCELINLDIYTDEKFDKKKAKKESSTLKHELKNLEHEISDRLILFESSKKTVNFFEELEEKIHSALRESRVIPFEPKLLDHFQLSIEEKTAWEYCAYNQDYYYYHLIINLLRRFIGLYQSAEEIMKPLCNQIEAAKNQLKMDFETINEKRKRLTHLTRTQKQIDIYMKAEKIARELCKQHHILEQKYEEKDVALSFSRKRESIKMDPAYQGNDRIGLKQKAWYLPLLVTTSKVTLSTAIGAGIGFLVGTIIGIFFGAGIGALFTAPLLSKLGGLIGFGLGTAYVITRKESNDKDKSISYTEIKPAKQVRTLSTSSRNAFIRDLMPKISHKRSCIQALQDDKVKRYKESNKKIFTPITNQNEKKKTLSLEDRLLLKP